MAPPPRGRCPHRPSRRPGRYIDEYACRDGDWRIVRRRELVDWAKSTPAADQFLKDNALPMGARRGADFSQTRNWPV
jgi:hypothetical protein